MDKWIKNSHNSLHIRILLNSSEGLALPCFSRCELLSRLRCHVSGSGTLCYFITCAGQVRAEFFAGANSTLLGHLVSDFISNMTFFALPLLSLASVHRRGVAPLLCFNGFSVLSFLKRSGIAPPPDLVCRLTTSIGFHS